MKLRFTNLSPNFIVFLLLCAFFVITFLSVLGKSLTYDEARNFNYGKALALSGDTNRPGDISILDGTPIAGSMMPVSALNALPFKLGVVLPDGLLKKILLSIETARLISVIISMLFALLIYRWTAKLYGFVPALFSLALYVFDPNIIAQSQLVTTDMYAWGTTLLVFYCAWKFANQRSWQNGALWSIALAVSALAKYTTVILIPLSLLTIFIHDLPELIQRFKAKPRAAFTSAFGSYTLYLFSGVAASILLINLGFLFNQTFMPFGEYKFHSHLLSGIQAQLPFLKNLPTPVPYPYLQGFDLTYYYGEEGKAFGDTYLLGQLKDGKEIFYGYYIIVAFFKVPIATQIIFWAALYLYLSNSANRKNFFTNDVFLLAPMLFFFLYFNLMFSINTGIRYYLVLFPLLYVFCGSVFKNWDNFTKLQKNISFGLGAYLCISMLAYFPTYMPYFNEFLVDKKQAYKILADSNIDYGQSENALKEFLAAHPEAHYNPSAPTAGLIVMSVNDLVGVFGKPQDFTWLRENFEPDDLIDRTYLVYHIQPAELEALCPKLGNCP